MSLVSLLVRSSMLLVLLQSTPRAQSPPPGIGDVRLGIDVLVRDQFRTLAGRRIGLITNHTGVDRAGRSTLDHLASCDRLELKALFAPEHGFEGRLDGHVADAVDAGTKLRIHSLYGKTRQPTAEMLEGLDTLVFDIQDIGCRFYTYISTMGLALEAAAAHGLRFVVLDRPNPLGGVLMEGPILDAGRRSFVGHHAIPIRHGMTVGELARLFVAELELRVDLEVIPVEGWRRNETQVSTGLAWTNPSPNMRRVGQALVYPGIGLLETTNVSVGRGTDTPFERLGAPWIDAIGLARALRARSLPGVAFVPVRFLPNAPPYAGEACHGLDVHVTDWATFRPVRCGFEIAVALRHRHPAEWESAGYLRLLGSQAIYAALLEGKDAEALERLTLDDLRRFAERRTPYLLYP